MRDSSEYELGGGNEITQPGAYLITHAAKDYQPRRMRSYLIARILSLNPLI
jgi:hypothetical protein